MEKIDSLNQVAEFHRTFNAPILENPQIPSAERSNLRIALLQEELNELKQAIEDQDIVEIADALGDQLYILCGTILKHGLQDKIAEVFAEIQRSNMSKLDADGNPIYREDGKVLKSELYFKPDIQAVLEK